VFFSRLRYLPQGNGCFHPPPLRTLSIDVDLLVCSPTRLRPQATKVREMDYV
jgi:hypothetical protein